MNVNNFFISKSQIVTSIAPLTWMLIELYDLITRNDYARL